MLKNKQTRKELFDLDLIDTPRPAPSPPSQPHTKLEANSCNTGPAPHLWAHTERTDVKSFCFTLWFLPSFLHPGPGCHRCSWNTTGHVMTVTGGRRDEMSGRRVDAVYEVYLGDRTTYLEGGDNTAHNEGNTRQNCKMRRKWMFTRH